MSNEKPETIWIITDRSLGSLIDDGYKSSTEIGGRIGNPKIPETLEERRVAVPVETIRRNMSNFLVVIDDLFIQAEQEASKNQLKTEQKSGLQLDEIELSVEINGKGEVSLWGIGGTSMGGKGSIVLKFRRTD